MSVRRKGRELALQVLYQLDMSGEMSEQGLHSFAESFDASPRAREFAWVLVRGVRAERAAIDAQVESVSEHWKLDRLAQIDATVIRIAVYEMTHGLPKEIAINEAVEVARRFGTSESAAFVNGVLDAVAKRMGLERGQKPVAS
ncbi:transcription antitermination factor NusB [bacterium]|nr:transcription antitermination factor NusB [bacterium]